MLTIKNWAEKIPVISLGLVLLLQGCSPSGPHALLDGIKRLDRGDTAGALPCLRRAAELLSTNAPAWNYLGIACHRSGDLPGAILAYQRALLLDHDLFEAHYNLGCAWMDQNRMDPAKLEFTTYTLRRPNAVEGWLKLGSAQLRSARVEPQSRELLTAERSFTEALRLSALNPEALNGIGLTRLERSRPREAVQYFEAALRQQKDYAPALLNLGVVAQVYLNNRELALQKYRDYLALPVRGAAWEAVNAAIQRIQVESGGGIPRPYEAPPAAHAPTNSASRPAAAGNPPASRGVGTVSEPSGSGAEPARPSSPPATVPIAGGERYAYAAPKPAVAGDTAAAHRVLQQGILAHQESRLPEAMQFYAQAIQLDPAYFDAYYDLGLAATSAGRLIQALNALETALVLRPDSLDARYYFGLALKQGGFFVDAANELERLLSTSPGQARAHLAAADLYAKNLRQPARAREHYLKALEADPHLSQAAAIRDWLTIHTR